jgi:ketosteroid isomerase-like protein
MGLYRLPRDRNWRANPGCPQAGPVERRAGPPALCAGYSGEPMSQENVEIVRRVYAEWSHGDFSAGAIFDADVEFDMVDWPGRDKSRGLAEMATAWQESLAAWDDFRAEPTAFIPHGAHVVVPTHVTARGKGSGAAVAAETATVWTLEHGMVVRLALHWDAKAALEAVGL